MQNKSDILILTSNYPHQGGEQFIEKEMPYWATSQFEHIYILPYQHKGEKRCIPDNAQVLIEDIPKNTFAIFYALLLLLCQSFFYQELIHITKKQPANIGKKYFIAIKTGINLLHYRRRLKRVLKKHPNITTIYSYWNDILSYAASLEKLTAKTRNLKVVTRAHGFDLYQERKPYQYMPYKWQFSSIYDHIFVLSPKAKIYYETTYPNPVANVSISRLGVKIATEPNHLKPLPQKHTFTIISIAYCVKVKRIDMTLAAILHLAKSNPQQHFTWLHFGGGELLAALQQQAQQQGKFLDNVKIVFMGHQDNSQIVSFLQTQSIHVLINNSEYEGTPVSIMEAMAEGIPVVAPDIGGISDIVEHNINGILLPSSPSIDQIASALHDIVFAENWQQLSQNAKLTAYEKYNAQHNFPEFIQKIENISSSHE